MTSRKLTTHIATLLVLLIGVLIGCGVTPPTSQDPEGNGDPSLSAMPVAALLKSMTMPVTRASTRTTTALPTPEIKLTFAASMNRSSVENAINVYPSGITPNSSVPKRLQVKALCDGGWQVRNPNDTPVSFEWAITKSVEQGAGMVAANGVQNLRTSTGFKQLRVISSGIVQARVLSTTGACVPTLEFIWAVDNKSVTVRPLQPMSSDALTVALSTGAFSSDGVRLENPSTETLVPEQEVKESQVITLSFSQAVNKTVLENSLKVFQGKFDPGTLIPTAPRVLQGCDGSYTVQNPSSSVLSFSWSVEGSNETGKGTVNENSETKITPLNPGALKVFTSIGANITRVLEGSTACSTQTFTTVWSADGSSVTLTPSSKWKLGTFTITGNAINESGSSVARESLAVVRVIADTVVTPPDPNPITPEAPLRAEVDPESFPVVATSGETATFSGFSSGGSSTDPNAPEPTIDWDFGDGTTATGAEVEHLFVDPGTYSVTTKVTNSSGVSDSVTQTVQVIPSMADLTKDINLTDGEDTLHIDLGTPVPGLKYKWQFRKQDGSVLSEVDGTTFDQRFAKLGTYEFALKILDYRDQLENTGLRTRSTRVATPTDDGQEEFDRTILQGQSFITRWELKPDVKLTAKIRGGGGRPSKGSIFTPDNSDVAQNDVLMVDSSKNPYIDFSAEDRKDYSNKTQQKYYWKVCKTRDKTCLETKPPTFTKPGEIFRGAFFGYPGEYIVELKTVDKYEQVDYHYRYVVSKDRENHFNRVVADYLDPQLGGATPTAITPASFSSRAAIQTRGTNLSFDDYFPFVLTSKSRIRRIATRWNAWENGSNYKVAFCDSVNGYTNGYYMGLQKFGEVTPDQDIYDPILGYYIGTLPNYNGLFCQFTISEPGTIPRWGARADNELLISGNQLQATDYDTFAGLRIPEISMNILPDELVNGDSNTEDASTSMVEEQSATINGEEKLLLTVRMRQSEYDRNQKLEFKVPVYAVNETGKLLTGVNGNFYANFKNLLPTESDCGDCVMVRGKAYITVRIDPARYAYDINNNNPLRLDLSQIQIGTDDGCDGKNSPIGKETYSIAFGCDIVDTSTLMPVGVAPTDITLKHFKYNILAESTNVFGLALYGSQSKAFQQILKIVKEGIELLVKDVEQLIDFIPVIGSVKGFMTAVSACANATTEGKPCDYFGVVLAGVTVMLDVVPGVGEVAALGLKSVGKIFTASRIGAKVIRFGLEVAEEAGAVARAIGNLAEEAAKKGAQRFEEIATPLKEKFARGWERLNQCIAKCAPEADSILSRSTKLLGEEEGSAVKVFDDIQKRAEAVGQSAACITKTLFYHVGEELLSEAKNVAFTMTQQAVESLFMKVDSVVKSRGRITTRGASSQNCVYEDFQEGIKNGDATYDPKSSYKNPDVVRERPKPLGLKNGVTVTLGNLFLLAPHHIVPYNWQDLGFCKRDTNVNPSAPINLCDAARSMLEDSNIAPIYHPCNGVLLPDTRKLKRIAKKSTGAKRDALALKLAQAFPNARDHANLHTNEYMNVVYKKLKTAWDASGLDSAKKEDRTVPMCVELQKIAFQLLESPGAGYFTGFDDLPKFSDNVTIKIANGWK
jgi:PKD domain